jgi:hypothetical protein
VAGGGIERRAGSSRNGRIPVHRSVDPHGMWMRAMIIRRRC